MPDLEGIKDIVKEAKTYETKADANEPWGRVGRNGIRYRGRLQYSHP